MEDISAFNDLPDVWCTSQQFLDMCAGDYEEHAILLCNYFNYIDRQANNIKDNKYVESFLILGKGLPEGNMVWVLRKDGKNNAELWNPKTGEC